MSYVRRSLDAYVQLVRSRLMRGADWRWHTYIDDGDGFPIRFLIAPNDPPFIMRWEGVVGVDETTPLECNARNIELLFQNFQIAAWILERTSAPLWARQLQTGRATARS